MLLLGEAAALTTAVCWPMVSLLFSVAARRTSSFAVNLTRITLAVGVLVTLVLLLQGTGWLEDLTPSRVLMLAVSGWIGLTLGDWALFSSFVYIGPRVAMLVMALAPPLAALFAVPLLGERIGPLGITGMVVTLSGVAWVILERPRTLAPPGHRIRGVILAFLGALGQGLGLVLSKRGMDEAIDPLPATLIRMTAAMVGVWILALAWGRSGEVLRVARDSRARLATLGATILGPVLGVWLSLVAVRHTETGIAATIMATVPVLVLPLVIFVQKEKVSARAAVGAVVAVAGVALLVLRGAP